MSKTVINTMILVLKTFRKNLLFGMGKESVRRYRINIRNILMRLLRDNDYKKRKVDLDRDCDNHFPFGGDFGRLLPY